MKVTELCDRFVPGDAFAGVRVKDLATVLQRPRGCMTQLGYAVDSRRIVRASLERGPIVMVACGADLDPPAHLENPAWCDEQQDKLTELVAELGGYAWRSRVGWHLVIAYREPVVLHTQADWDCYSERMLAAHEELRTRWGLDPDRACKEPGRLLSLPRAGVATIGSLERLGAFELPAAAPPKDYEFHVPAAEHHARGVAAGDVFSCTAPAGELWDLLVARGLVVKPCPRGGWVVRCPNEAQHTSGASGDGSSIYYSPTAAEQGGWFACKHAHCQQLDLGDWLALLGAPKRQRRTVRIVSAREDSEVQYIRLEIIPVDGKGPVYPPTPRWPAPRPGPAVLTVAIARSWGSKPVRTRYASLWSAAGIAAPCDAKADGDLGGAIDELPGRTLDIEIGTNGKVRRILPAREQAA